MANARGLPSDPFMKSFWMSIKSSAVCLWSLLENYRYSCYYGFSLRVGALTGTAPTVAANAAATISCEPSMLEINIAGGTYILIEGQFQVLCLHLQTTVDFYDS